MLRNRQCCRRDRPSGFRAPSFLAVAAVAWGLGAFVAALLMRKGDYSVAAAGFYAATGTICPIFFVLIGALTGQLFSSRRAAASAGGVLFAVFYFLRIAANSLEIHWLRWTTPFGWTNIAEPFGENRWTVFIVFAIAAASLFVAVVQLSAARDYGSGVLRDESVPQSSLRGLDTLFGLTFRLRQSSAIGWIIATVCCSTLMGVLTRSEMTIAKTSDDLDNVLDRLGIGGAGIERYAGTYFLLLSLILCMAAVGFAAASRDEEAQGRLDVLLSLPVRRLRWIAQRVFLHFVTIVALCMVSGFGMWAGIHISGEAASIAPFLRGGLNLIPVVLFTFAVGTLLYGVFPRLTAAGTYTLVGWSFLIQLIAATTTSLSCIFTSSMFHYLRLVPSQPVDVTATLVFLALAFLAAAVGMTAFRQRDLAVE